MYSCPGHFLEDEPALAVILECAVYCMVNEGQFYTMGGLMKIPRRCVGLDNVSSNQ